MKKIIILVLSIMILVSCEENFLINSDNDDKGSISIESITGDWSNEEYQDSIITVKKVNQLPQDKYGISFRSDGTLREWKNVGFCGTPPITYGEFEGNWELKNDSVLVIEGTYWGGDFTMEWKILEISDNSIKYYIMDLNYKMDS